MTETDGSSEPVAGEHYFALPRGTLLLEFRIESVLGSGGFGITYLATDTLLQEQVAIKEYLPNELAVRTSDATVRAKTNADQAQFRAGLKAFLEEARMMARFRHANIVHVRRFFELHGTGYIVQDYVQGDTLARRLAARPLDEKELRDILDGVLNGLEVVHERAILHRDLKPNNIMLRKDGAPVLIDFGAARDFGARDSRLVTAIATPGYSPHEQYGEGGQQGPWSDLYALGAIAYRAVTGATPTHSVSRLRKDPLVPAVVAAEGRFTPNLLRAIDWMMRIDEAERPASVAIFRGALAAGDIPGPARRSPVASVSIATADGEGSARVPRTDPRGRSRTRGVRRTAGRLCDDRGERSVDLVAPASLPADFACAGQGRGRGVRGGFGLGEQDFLRGRASGCHPATAPSALPEPGPRRGSRAPGRGPASPRSLRS